MIARKVELKAPAELSLISWGEWWEKWGDDAFAAPAFPSDKQIEGVDASSQLIENEEGAPCKTKY